MISQIKLNFSVPIKKVGTINSVLWNKGSIENPMAELLKKPLGVCEVQTDLIGSMQAPWKSADEHRVLFEKFPDAIVIV